MRKNQRRAERDTLALHHPYLRWLFYVARWRKTPCSIRVRKRKGEESEHGGWNGEGKINSRRRLAAVFRRRLSFLTHANGFSLLLLSSSLSA